MLVHGAWVGEWSWSPVVPALERSGRPVHTVSLRGHGVRGSESGPHVTLDDHVDDVVDLIETFDLDTVTLVGHSYGGRVITRASPRVADRLSRLVYLDAHAPLGDAAVAAATTRLGADAEKLVVPSDRGPDADGMVPFSGFAPDPAEFGGQASIDWFLARIRPQSAATLAADFVVDLPGHVDRTYVAATADPDSPFAAYSARARCSPDWRHVELDCSHWVMIARPAEVASIILDPDRWGANSPVGTTPSGGTR